jgi:hypothetical protein
VVYTGREHTGGFTGAANHHEASRRSYGAVDGDGAEGPGRLLFSYYPQEGFNVDWHYVYWH